MRCPVCRAQVDQGPQCRRCRADLSLLFELEEQRRRALAVALGALRQGNCQQALGQIDRAAALRQDRDVQQLRALVHLLQGDYPQALTCALSEPGR